jgi:hypothetical protein
MCISVGCLPRKVPILMYYVWSSTVTRRLQTPCLKVPIHVWLASPAGLGFQWVKLVSAWNVTSRTLAIIYIRAYLPSQVPEADSRARLVRVWAP